MSNLSPNTFDYQAFHRMADSEFLDEQLKSLKTASLEAVKRHGHGLDPQMHGVIRNAFYSGAAFNSKK